jgi:altronate dehydratase
MIEIRDARLLAELKSMDLTKGKHIFTTQDGKKATLNYMNVIASRDSIRGYGEGRIAKILVKHLIDTKQFDKVEALSKQRGTALGTIYTTYNIMDNKV